jgi:hypothetical protein
MLGLGLLIRLGRQVVGKPLAEAGMLPAGYYRHLTLEALEEEDFHGALRFLKWAGEPLLAQIMVLRLRLLKGRHRRQVDALRELLATDLAPDKREKSQGLLAAETQALQLLKDYADQALGLVAAGPLGPGLRA